MELLQPANLLAWALQAGAVVLLAAPLPRLFGVWSPRTRMIFWRTVLLTCLLLPALQPWAVRQAVAVETPPAGIATTVAAADANLDAALSATVRPDPAPAPWSDRMAAAFARWRAAWPMPFGLAEVLMAGVVLRLSWLGLGVITLRRLRLSARPLWPRPDSVDRAATLAETDAEFLVSATASRPVTCGLLWPVVLVPRQFETFPEREQTAIACHELLHVRRSDWIRNTADELLRAVFWFHPAAWWAINEIQLAREQVVDREVVRRLGARQPYLEALLRLARPAPRLITMPAALFLKRAHLRQRVTLLVKEVAMSRARLAASVVIMALVVFAGAYAVTSAFPLQQTGTRTPGAQTAQAKPASQAVPGGSVGAARPGMTTSAKLPDAMVSLDLGEAPLRAALAAIGQMGGITISYSGVPADLLDRVLTWKMAKVSLEQALSFMMQSQGLAYRVVGPRAILVTPARDPSGIAGGVAGGVSGGVAGGVAGGTSGGVRGGVAGGIVGGVAGGVQDAPVRMKEPNLQFTIDDGLTDVVHRVDPSAAGASGRAVLGVVIDASGRVEAAAPVGAPGAYYAPLVEAAADAARQWQFTPGQTDGRTTLVGFNFTEHNTAGLSDTPTIRIGGSVPPPPKLRDVKPVYPKDAQAARLQGIQILEIAIDPSGVVLDARARRGQVGLLQSAIDAVLQWRFTPWSGPERRVMTVTVNYTLTDGPGKDSPARDTSAARTPSEGAQALYGEPTDWPADAIKVGDSVKPPTKIRDVKPVYPKAAQEARVQGIVLIDVLIGPDGKVKDARVQQSIPQLDQAAYDAVRQWEFVPTLLNGNPSYVRMTVTVNFMLQ